LRKLNQQFWRLLLYLSIADFFSDGAMLYGTVGRLLHGYVKSQLECDIQSFLIEVFFQVGTIYVLVITIWIYRASTNKDKTDWNWKTELMIQLVVWLYPISLAIIPLSGVGGIRYSGSDTTWCWVDGKPIYARFVFAYINNWSSILIIIVLRVLVWKKNSNNEMMEYLQPDRGNPMFRHLFWYPLTWIVIWLPGTINRVVQVFAGEYRALTFVQCLFIPLQGAVNAVIFVCTTNLIIPFKNRWQNKEEFTSFKSVNYGEADEQLDSQSRTYGTVLQ